MKIVNRFTKQDPPQTYWRTNAWRSWPDCCCYFHLCSGVKSFLPKRNYAVLQISESSLHPFPRRSVAFCWPEPLKTIGWVILMADSLIYFYTIPIWFNIKLNFESTTQTLNLSVFSCDGPWVACYARPRRIVFFIIIMFFHFHLLQKGIFI